MSAFQTRQGSLKIVDATKVAARGALFVTEARLRSMLKWVWLIISIAIANPVLYLVSIGLGLGSYIDQNAGNAGVDGVSYLTFLAPALLATAAIQGAMDESVYPTLEGFKWNKTFFSMNATPLSGNHIAMGVFFNSLIRTVFTAILYWLVMLAFGVLESPRAWLAIFTAVMAGAAFGALMQALAGMLENEDVFFTLVERFIVMPLFLFSGTFYPLSSMPIFLQWIGWISPLWHATELGRWLTYGSDISTTMLFVHFIFLNSILIFGLFASRRIFTRRLGK
jgi:lipooligosaccharide transport system permease protein